MKKNIFIIALIIAILSLPYVEESVIGFLLYLFSIDYVIRIGGGWIVDSLKTISIKT